MKPSKELIARIRSGMASDQEMREAGPEEVRAVKADSEVMHFRFAIKRAPKSLDDQQRTVEHIASTQDQDRMGDRIMVRGWELAEWQRNPVVLWDHDQSGLPVGRGVKARKTVEEGVGPALMITTRFHEEDKNPKAQLIYRMVADGDLPAGSVGFNPIAISRPKSEEEAKEFGVGEYGVRFDKQSLLEWSIVTVPANAGALAKRLEKRLDELHNSGEYSWALLDEVAKALRGEAPAQRVFSVPDLACVVVDEMPSETRSATPPSGSVMSSVFQVGGPVADGSSGDVTAWISGTGNYIPWATAKSVAPPTIDEIRAVLREESRGFDASLRAIRAAVRDELSAAIGALSKNTEQRAAVAPVESRAGSADVAEPEVRADQQPTEATDLYASILSELKSGGGKAK